MKTLSITQSVCIEYDEIMLHHRKTFSASHFGDTTDEDVDSNAKTVIRYALDTYLRWPRSILLKRLTMRSRSRSATSGTGVARWRTSSGF